MKKTCFYAVLLLAVLIQLGSCKKEYLIGGAPEDMDQYKSMTNVEVLAQDPLFDTLVQVIKAAGLEDEVNQPNSTFFAASDISIFHYLNARTIYIQNNVDINGKFTLDSLLDYVSTNRDNTRDSLLMYLVPQALPFAELTNTGKYYETGLSGDNAIISYEFTYNSNYGYNPLVSTVPQIVYYTHLWYPYDLNDNNPAGDVPDAIGVRTRVITSGIPTASGYLNLLEPNHTLFFYGTKL